MGAGLEELRASSSPGIPMTEKKMNYLDGSINTSTYSSFFLNVGKRWNTGHHPREHVRNEVIGRGRG